MMSACHTLKMGIFLEINRYPEINQIKINSLETARLSIKHLQGKLFVKRFYEIQKQPPEMFCKEGVLKIFPTFTR